MKEVSFTELKRTLLRDIKQGECLKVTGDGGMAFYVIVHPEEVMMDRVEAIADMIDKSRGF